MLKDNLVVHKKKIKEVQDWLASAFPQTAGLHTRVGGYIRFKDMTEL